ncbi:MAG: acylneuraminate cytidylyltransferase family protein [Dorea sp.]|jgi:CMP-N,N'-diacetyllegionaminic acid synthase|nr:acylneuraminate cytidylyltransferase family protein [Dorea sp.]
MKNIAIIPARSGSKGLRDKNIAKLNGKPLMYYSIRAAIDSGEFDEVMVSTDSEKYAEIARKCGANVPFLRSTGNSLDSSGTWDAVREMLAAYRTIGKSFDYVMVLQPTSPLRSSDDIKMAFEIHKKKQGTNVVSVVEVEHPIQWCFRLDGSLSMREFAQSPYNAMRRQELEMFYRENGAIYLVDAVKIMEEGYNLYDDNCFACVMPRERSVDIDYEIDLRVAEIMMNRQEKL